MEIESESRLLFYYTVYLVVSSNDSNLKNKVSFWRKNYSWDRFYLSAINLHILHCTSIFFNLTETAVVFLTDRKNCNQASYSIHRVQTYVSINQCWYSLFQFTSNDRNMMHVKRINHKYFPELTKYMYRVIKKNHNDQKGTIFTVK